MKKRSRTKFAQNRIEYIVYGNPAGVKKIVKKYGEKPPKNIHDLVDVTFDLKRTEKRKFVKDLFKVHPDRDLVLLATGHQPGEDNFSGGCGCSHSSYTGEESPDLLDKIFDLGTEELERFYKDLKEKANKNPQSAQLKEDVQLVWDELRQRKAKDKEESFYQKNKNLIHLGAAFLAGVIIVKISN